MRVAPSPSCSYDHESEAAQATARRSARSLSPPITPRARGCAAIGHRPAGRFQAGSPDRAVPALRPGDGYRRLVAAARRRRRAHLRARGREPAPSPAALLSARRQDAARRIRDLDPARRRASPRRRPAMVRSHRHALGRRGRRGPALGDGRRVLRSRARVPAPPPPLARTSLGRARLRLPAHRIGVRASLATCAWMRWRRNPDSQHYSDEATP